MDRRALPEPEWGRSAQQGEFVAPRTPAEQQLAAIWSEVLNVERIGFDRAVEVIAQAAASENEPR